MNDLLAWRVVLLMVAVDNRELHGEDLRTTRSVLDGLHRAAWLSTNFSTSVYNVPHWGDTGRLRGVLTVNRERPNGAAGSC